MIKTEFISAEELFDDIKVFLFNSLMKVDLEEFRSNKRNEVRFWNLIYYFNEYHLPFEFILPYQDKTFDKQMKKYKSRVKKPVINSELKYKH